MSFIRLTIVAILSLFIFSACSSDSTVSKDFKAANDDVFHGPADPDNTNGARGSYEWMNNRMNEEQVGSELNADRPFDTVGEGGDDNGGENESFQP